MPKQEYTKKEMLLKYGDLSYKEKAEVLYEALDYMSQYNGRSKFLCIALAMGYEETNEELYVKRRTS